MALKSLVFGVTLASMLGIGAAQALTDGEARHLLLRTGFNATPAEIAALAPLDRARAIERVVKGVRAEPFTKLPAFVAAPRPDWPGFRRNTDEVFRMQFNRARDAEANELKVWWYGEMIATPSPFTERLVLFWHNHFTSSMDKVRMPDLLYRQNALFRKEAAGSFRRMLHEIAKDPAMVRYLDSAANRKGVPNENFARELLELFTLGEGHYSERDIKEAARAFTGWHFDEPNGLYRFNEREHDTGAKTFLGKGGNLTGEQVLDIILDQPRTAVFITAKLWREFVSEEPAPRRIEALAAIFRKDYSIAALMQAMLGAPEFWEAENRGTLVKSPAEFIVGTVRGLGLTINDSTPLVNYGRRMRQDLFNPPNVRGWPGGVAWISTHTLLERRDIASRLLAGSDAPPKFENVVAMLAISPVVPPPAGLNGRPLVDHYVFDPSYQVK